MSDGTILILIAGVVVFAVTTLAALWTGYLLLQQRWVAENPGLTFEDDDIRPLFAAAYDEQLGRRQAQGPTVSESRETP